MRHDEPTAITPRSEPRDPERIGQFRIERLLGRGGMGVVYLAIDERTASRVALKILPKDLALRPNRVERFLTEAKAAGAIEDGSIIRIFESGLCDGYHYIEMEFVDGAPLSEVVRSARDSAPGRLIDLIAPTTTPALSSAETRDRKRVYFLDIAAALERVARALDRAHRRGILHRDVNPRNILIDRKGQPRLCDFGLARIEGGVPLTTTGEFLGTPGYVSPEQAEARAVEIGPATDVYSLGATLFHCLTGRPPFVVENPADLLLQIREMPPPEPRSIDPAVPEDLARVALRCLEKAPARRYASAAELADDLARFAAGSPVLARRSPAPIRWWRRVRPRRWQLAAKVALLAIATLVVVLVLLVLSHEKTLAHTERLDGIYALVTDDYRRATEKLSRAVEHDGSDYLSYLFLALSASARGLDSSSYRKAAAASGGAEPYLALLDARSPEAESVVLPSTGDSDMDALLELYCGIAHLRRNQLEKAKAYFERSAARKPSFALPLLQLALVCDRLDQWAAAIEAIERYLSLLGPATDRYRLGLAVSKRIHGDLRGALADLDSMPEPSLTPFVLLMRGRTCQDLYERESASDRRLIEQAIADFKRAGATDPSQHVLAVNLAAALFVKGSREDEPERIEEAERILRKQLDQDPRNADALLVLGAIRQRQERLPEALELFTEAKEILPTNLWPRFNLTSVHYEVGVSRFRSGDASATSDEFRRAKEEWEGMFGLLPPFDRRWGKRIEIIGEVAGRIADITREEAGYDGAIAFLERALTKVDSGFVQEVLATNYMNRGQVIPPRMEDLDRAAMHFEAARSSGLHSPHVLVSLLYLYSRFGAANATPTVVERAVEETRGIRPLDLDPGDAVNFAVGLCYSGIDGTCEEACEVLRAAGLSDPTRVNQELRTEIIDVLDRCDCAK